MAAQAKPRRRRLALVASRGSLDGAYPPLILAATAASLGWEVGIFFTFYGLDILHKKRHKRLKVAPIGNPAMPVAIPNLVGALPGMTAAATTMMRRWMKRANLPTIPQFLDMARESGARLFACSTTMGVMGIREQDLVVGADIAGAAAFLDFAAEADVSLFV
ncbi:MAG TPA: DsrE/DsrF/DrsH-like family protein [Gemmatimonadales bacterium]|nr:DsrE/DsrF/DrsH-like family protein [Gemmatimonadales bacterium]